MLWCSTCVGIDSRRLMGAWRILGDSPAVPFIWAVLRVCVHHCQAAEVAPAQGCASPGRCLGFPVSGIFSAFRGSGETNKAFLWGGHSV